MEVKPYDIAGSKKEQVSKMFDSIAKRYDFLNHFLSLGVDKWWRKKMIDELDSLKPGRILDVATGTADVAIATVKRFPVQKIIGVDVSPQMLAFGRKKIQAEGMEQTIELQDGESENLQFENNIFDAVTVAYGVRNFERLDKGLSEMYRVLKPSGKLVVLEFSKPTMFPLKQAFNFYFQHILPVVGKLTSKDPKAYEYLYQSVQAFPNGAAFVKILATTGFKSIQCKPLSFGICSIYTGIK